MADNDTVVRSALDTPTTGTDDGAKLDTKPTLTEAEKRASRMGWKPEPQYKGDKPWVDATEFLRVYEEEPAVLKTRLNKTEADNKRLQQQMVEMQQSAQALHKLAYEQGMREWKEKHDALAAAKAKAITEGDGEMAVTAEAALDEHKAAKPTPQAAPANNTPPEITAWRTENSWYDTDPIMAGLANGAAQALYAKGERDNTKLLKAMREAVEERFPEYFDEPGNGAEDEPPPKPKATPQRGGRTGGVTRSTAKTYENLPREAKEACDKLVRHKFVKDRAQYVAMFDWKGLENG